MIVDASAVIAILHGEPGAQRLAEAIGAADNVRISSVSIFEASLKTERSGAQSAARIFDSFVRDTGMEIVAFEAEHAAIARDARRRYGKGSGHPAKLNFGDCMTYATAYIADEPLLYTGDDFAHTDLKSAL